VYRHIQPQFFLWTLVDIEEQIMSTRQTQIWAGPRRILLATDLTDLNYTLPGAIQQAQAFKAELKIAHILPNPNAPLIDPVLMLYCEPDRMYKAAETTIKEALKTAKSAGVPCSSHLIAGDVVDEIIKIAQEWKADRLIAGSHGKTKFHLQILGSVAESLFHRIEIPILAIGPHAHPQKNASGKRMRIVFATSLDHDSRQMAEFALSVAENHCADISLLYVSSEIAQGHPSSARVTNCAENMLQDLLSVRPLKRSIPVGEVLHGQPANAILEYAKRHSADMIILGASAHSAFDSRFIPGTAYRVLCESPCPVLVLKQGSTWANAPREAAQAQGTHSAS
jgi:nucleotide-binding universal stress UspA family protein